MTDRLPGKVVIVTGGASGLGEATCVRLAEEGAAVVVVDIDGDGARRTAAAIASSGGAALAVAADISTEAGNTGMVAEAIASFGTVDGLVCNAGLVADGTVLDLDPAVWDQALGVMLTGTWLGIRAVLPTMVERQSGAIVAQSSIAALVGVKRLAAYAAAKAGLVGLVRQFAVEFAPEGIRANAITAGLVPTPLVESMYRAREERGKTATRSLSERLRDVGARYPLGLGDPVDVANAVLFLLSDESRWITGQVLVVDGGFTAT